MGKHKAYCKYQFRSARELFHLRVWGLFWLAGMAAVLAEHSYLGIKYLTVITKLTGVIDLIWIP